MAAVFRSQLLRNSRSNENKHLCRSLIVSQSVGRSESELGAAAIIPRMHCARVQDGGGPSDALPGAERRPPGVEIRDLLAESAAPLAAETMRIPRNWNRSLDC